MVKGRGRRQRKGVLRKECIERIKVMMVKEGRRGKVMIVNKVVIYSEAKKGGEGIVEKRSVETIKIMLMVKEERSDNDVKW